MGDRIVTAEGIGSCKKIGLTAKTYNYNWKPEGFRYKSLLVAEGHIHADPHRTTL